MIQLARLEWFNFARSRISAWMHIKRRLSGNLPNRRAPAHGIFVDRCAIYSKFTSNAKRWAQGCMFSSTKYEHFVHVSSNQKHIYNVIWRMVWSGEHFKATVVYFACSHGGFACSHVRISPSVEIRSTSVTRNKIWIRSAYDRPAVTRNKIEIWSTYDQPKIGLLQPRGCLSRHIPIQWERFLM